MLLANATAESFGMEKSRRKKATVKTNIQKVTFRASMHFGCMELKIVKNSVFHTRLLIFE